MADEIDRTGDGRDAMAYRGRTPWHRKGTELTAEEARNLAHTMEAAGLNFEVAKIPHYTLEPMPPDAPQAPDLVRDGIPYRVHPSKDSCSVIRQDTRKVLGTADPSWHLLQNRDAFAPLRSVLEDGIASIETAGVLREGRQVWMLVRFDVDPVVERAWQLTRKREDKAARSRLLDTFRGKRDGGILPYGLFTNDHSGSRRAQVRATAVRVVCANTLEWSLRSDEGFCLEVAHDQGVKESYAEAAEQLLRYLTRRYQKLADQRELLQARILDEKTFLRLVLDQAAPIEFLKRGRTDRSVARFAEKLLEMRLQRRAHIRRLWDEGAGHRGDHSAWEAYNALVEWTDHAESADSEAHRVESLTDGRLRMLKQRVFVALLRHAENTVPEEFGIPTGGRGWVSNWATKTSGPGLEREPGRRGGG